MKKFSAQQLIDNLKREGLRFSTFSLTQEGNYTVADADWNYKDVPHLHHIHRLVESYMSYVDDATVATINMQKVLGLKFPLAVFNYESGYNSQTYYTTWFFYALIIETRYEELAAMHTRVTTTYAIGYPAWLKWSLPLLRWILKRNYADLMSGDIPMRERRGQLRSWGYSFAKSTPTYSFEKTMQVMETNVIPPAQDIIPASQTLDLNQLLPHDGEYFYAKSDRWGLRIQRCGNNIALYPRLCPHEGANLDSEKCINNKVKCPWHGRLHAPLATLTINTTDQQRSYTPLYEVILENNQLTLQPLLTANITPATADAGLFSCC